METVYIGKTKNVYKLFDGNYMLKFKNDATGEDGVFDPGANKVGLSIEGMGQKSLKMTEYFFKQAEKIGIKTQMLDVNLEKAEMIVKPCESFGEGLEIICRYYATGSFIRRYGKYIKDGQKLDSLIEMTIKDDERNDPLANEDILLALNILKVGDYQKLKHLAQKVSDLVKEDLANKALTLYDIKLEFGIYKDEIILMDEISSGNMRVYKDEKIIDPIELANYYQ